MFEVRDEVFYPGHGVAEVQEVVDKDIGGKKEVFFKLKFKYKDMTVLVPKNRLEKCKVRFISSRETLALAISELYKGAREHKTLKECVPAGWSKRQKEYQAKIESGDILEVAMIYRDLQHSTKKKPLSFGEKGIMLLAQDLLYQELLSVQGCEQGVARKILQEPFEKDEKCVPELVGV